MAAGLSTALADALLGDIPTTLYVQLHTGDPGSAGTVNVSSVTTREELTLGTAASGEVSESNTPEWTDWAGTNEEEDTYISLWTAATGGTFEDSVELAEAVTMTTGADLTLTGFSISFPVAS